MKVAQVIPCLGQNSGGPSRSVYELTKGLRSTGMETDILTNNYLENPNIAADSWIHSVDIPKMLPFEFNTKFKKVLCDNDYDLFHIHSIYSYPVSLAAKYARRKGIPYIIAPRGSLYEAALDSSSSFKKKVFNHLFLFSDLNHASVIHATCEEEMLQIRRLGIKAPIAIIPNSISLPSEKPQLSAPNMFRLCYLGRINPIKNIDGILKAWHSAGMSNRKDAELVIIGDSKLEKEKVYLESLHQLEQTLRIENISWKGALSGDSKDKMLNSCSFLILPSYSENFGMVVVEALVQGVPVVASKGTPWKSLEAEDCGWWINNSVEEMSNLIRQLSEVSNERRKEMGLRGQQFVEDNFSTDSVCKSLRCLYEWVLGKGAKPEFVY